MPGPTDRNKLKRGNHLWVLGTYKAWMSYWGYQEWLSSSHQLFNLAPQCEDASSICCRVRVPSLVVLEWASACLHPRPLAVCDWEGTACVIAQDVVSGNVHVGLCYGLHFFSSSAHKLDGLGNTKEYAPRSEHVPSSPGHWSHTWEPSSSHAAASTFKVCASKRNLLTLRITCLDRSRWRYRGTLIGIRSFLEKGMANQKW